jgi:hypothetical protein
VGNKQLKPGAAMVTTLAIWTEKEPGEPVEVYSSTWTSDVILV